jgi:hypothetical protein
MTNQGTDKMTTPLMTIATEVREAAMWPYEVGGVMTVEVPMDKLEGWATRIEAEAREGTWADLSAHWNAEATTPPAIEPDWVKHGGFPGDYFASLEKPEPAIEAGAFMLVPVRLPALAISEIKDMLEADYGIYDAKARPLWSSLLRIVTGMSLERQISINEQRQATTQPPAPALTVDELEAVDYLQWLLTKQEKPSMFGRMKPSEAWDVISAALRRITQPGGKS